MIQPCCYVVLLNEQFQNKRKRSILKEFRCFDDIFERNYFHPHELFIFKFSLIALLLSEYSNFDQSTLIQMKCFILSCQQLKTLLTLIALIAEEGQFTYLKQEVSNGLFAPRARAEAHRSPQRLTQDKSSILFFIFNLFSVKVGLVRETMEMDLRVRVQFYFLSQASCVASISVGLAASL